MAKPVKLKRKQYEKLISQIKIDYKHKPSVYLVRERMKTTLGFTIRHESKMYEDFYVVEFFDNRKETLFLMKYGYLLDE
jgi:hypothetical protein